jgi:bacteriorhodopsin
MLELLTLRDQSSMLDVSHFRTFCFVFVFIHLPLSFQKDVDWVITTPLLLLELLLATGLPLSDLFTTLFLDEVMIGKMIIPQKLTTILYVPR